AVAVWNMPRLETFETIEPRAEDVRGAAGAAAERVLARRLANFLQQVLQIVRLDFLRHDQHDRNDAGHGDRLDAVDLIFAGLVHLRRNHELARVAEEQGLAVGRRARRRGDADGAGAARPVEYHDRLVPALLQLLSDRAGDEVGRAAGAVGDNDLNVARGVGRQRLSALRRRRQP